MIVKLKRGQKQCSNCQKTSGARAYVCVHCNRPFKIKNKSSSAIIKNNRTPISNWQSLQAGECIRVIIGSGPYRETPDGREYVGHSGKFLVMSTTEIGINAYGISKHNHGYAFIYMGPTAESPSVPGIIRSAHKIVLSKRDR